MPAAKEALAAHDDLDVRMEELQLFGYVTLDSGLSQQALDKFSATFNQAEASYKQSAAERHIDLAAIGGRNTIRVLSAIAPAFWDIIFNERLHGLLPQTLGDYYIPNQVNGLVNRVNASRYSQAAYHRDLPYQHFVCSWHDCDQRAFYDRRFYRRKWRHARRFGKPHQRGASV